MPDWATGWAMYTFTLGLAFYCGTLATRLTNLKESLIELKADIKEEFKKLHDELENVRKNVDTRKVHH